MQSKDPGSIPGSVPFFHIFLKYYLLPINKFIENLLNFLEQLFCFFFSDLFIILFNSYLQMR